MATETLWAEFLQRLLLSATLAGPTAPPPQPEAGAAVRTPTVAAPLSDRS